MMKSSSVATMLLVAWGSLSLLVHARADESAGKVRIAELSPQAELAIDKSLRYLAENQNADGGWGKKYRPANTALALMAFMVKGHFPDQEPFGQTLAKGLDYLLRTARDGGGYMGENMYEHGLATLALSEIWGMTRRGDEVRDALKRAVDVILRAQNPQGGWRYHPRPQDADISATVMQIMALASAKEAGILVPDATIQKAVKYVKSCQNANGGFGYQSPRDPAFARTAAGVTSLLMCGERNSPAVQKGLDYLRNLPPDKFKGDQWYYYGHYYGVQAMYQAGDQYYQDWYPRIRDALLQSQNRDGSWRGEEYCTPMAVLILGVPYRFLPIYQR